MRLHQAPETGDLGHISLTGSVSAGPSVRGRGVLGGLPAASPASLRELSPTLCLGSVRLSTADAQAYRGRSESSWEHGHACTRCRVKPKGAQAADPFLGPVRWCWSWDSAPGQSRGKCEPSTVLARGPPGAVSSLDPRVITQCFHVKYALLSTRTKLQQLTAGGRLIAMSSAPYT